MSLCGATQPEQLAITCDKSAPNHEVHSGFNRQARVMVEWPNLSYVEPVQRATRPLKEVARGVRTIVRANDPVTAHRLAEAYEPTSGTKRDRVARYLIDHLGEWIDAPTFTTEEVGGGFAATRRLRELREDYGWPIETRERPESPNTWQHRLSSIPEGVTYGSPHD